ncbi:MAG TPA: hypothetical protein VNK43_11325 [Gemmatimonadales bacterium]|nr:hypothetical protein [Gemmatimonadales bacterium]
MNDQHDDRFDEWLAREAAGYNRPPEPPREEMWRRIEAARRSRAPRSAPGGGDVLPFRRPGGHPLRPAAVGWGVGIAAVLALGIGIGRMLPRGADSTRVPVATDPSTPLDRRGDAAPSRALAVETVRHLARAEMLLTAVRTGPRDAQFSAAARDLLATTRLLLDSRAVTDPRTRALLEDLELVLAQIAPADGADDLDLVVEALEERDMMPRLRTVIPAGPMAGLQGEL